LEKGVVDEEIAFVENQREMRLRLLAPGMIIFAAPPLYWRSFD
tara:strand:- start:291 stop:419 length:129 start_codon:yes stop_codon:yes gene_type:complete